jgi:hypothetical protein
LLLLQKLLLLLLLPDQVLQSLHLLNLHIGGQGLPCLLRLL